MQIKQELEEFWEEHYYNSRVSNWEFIPVAEARLQYPDRDFGSHMLLDGVHSFRVEGKTYVVCGDFAKKEV